MKILTGSLKGRVISFKPNPHLRPTADKVRKAIFDMLQGALEGKRVLDLFSGTGALGFEALSNGASSVAFVEENKAQAEGIEKSLSILGLKDRATVLSMDALKALERFSRNGSCFDFIFLDPPYKKGYGEKILRSLCESKTVKAGSIIVSESSTGEESPENLAGISKIKEKIYGDTKIDIYQVLTNFKK